MLGGRGVPTEISGQLSQGGATEGWKILTGCPRLQGDETQGTWQGRVVVTHLEVGDPSSEGIDLV